MCIIIIPCRVHAECGRDLPEKEQVVLRALHPVTALPLSSVRSYATIP